MKNLFPGMNPYLEQPEFWSDFHTRSAKGELIIMPLTGSEIGNRNKELV